MTPTEPAPSDQGVPGVVVPGLDAPAPAAPGEGAAPATPGEVGPADAGQVLRPLDGEAPVLERGGRPTSPVAPPADGDDQSDAPSQPTEEEAAKGLSLYQRMGVPLPAVPPEKPYDGPIDEAYGAYQRGLYLTALDKALPRAQLGDSVAQTLIAEMTARGLGVKRDPKAAAFWYGQAAAGGDNNAMFQYALLLMEGRFVERDKAKADDYMRRAADAGNASAQFNWAQILVSEHPGRRGLEMALPYYEKSADQGIADAQYAVSQIYNALPGVSAEKRGKARELLERAAKAGFDTAQLDMGLWLVNAVGGERDYEEGFRWLGIAANRGNVVAQNRLAHLYINALGTGPDPVEAAKWYVVSRRAGLKDPMLEDFYLGLTEEQQKKAIDAANRFRVK